MREMNNIDDIKKYIQRTGSLNDTAVQNVNLTSISEFLRDSTIRNNLFFGCEMDEKLTIYLIKNDNMVFPCLDVPYNPYINRLYTVNDLYDQFEPDKPDTYSETLDAKIYRHYEKTGKGNSDSIMESLARRLHDYSITDALMDILKNWNEKKIVAIMGGHSLARTSPDYLKAALVSKGLGERGYMLLSGGGPGAMEATHLGAYFAGQDESVIRDAVDMMKEGASYRDPLWLSAAFKVIEKYPRKDDALRDIGIPTWLYGHEPPTPFAGKIGKYFANSVREEGLLALAKGGVVYTPGSAGTIQEIFQDAAQNHYSSYGYPSPMVFLNKEYWLEKKPVYQVLLNLAEGYEYKRLISISDDVEYIIDTICDFGGPH